MAYIFPANPYDGQLYPVPPAPGSLQYQWSAAAKCWFIYSPLGVQSVAGILPIVVTNNTSDAVVRILPATINSDGAMSAQDKVKLDNIPANAGVGTVTEVASGDGLLGGPITTTGTLRVKPATPVALGGVKIGDNIQVTADGTISVPTASFGVTQINLGPGLIGSPSPITNVGTITAALATRLTVGAVRVGNGLNVTLDGTLSLGGSLGDVGVLAWGAVSVSSTSPYIFDVNEGYNIASVEWRGIDPAPRVRVYFQRPLTNLNYGVFVTAIDANHASGEAYFQESISINPTAKTITYVDLTCMAVQTQDWRVDGSGGNLWNKWNKMISFDIMITDTAVY